MCTGYMHSSSLNIGGTFFLLIILVEPYIYCLYLLVFYLNNITHENIVIPYLYNLYFVVHLHLSPLGEQVLRACSPN